MSENSNYIICFWILFGFNCLIYGFCCIMIIKRKKYTCISIRSPTLLLSNVLSNFFMITIIVLYEIYKENYISSFYYIFRIIMVLSLILRYERILICYKINSMNKKEIELDRKQFTEKRYLFQEKFYMRILLGVFIIFLAIMIILKILNIRGIEFFYTNNYIYNFNESNLNEEDKFPFYKTQMLIWIIWNFIEQFILITYIFRTFYKNIKEKIKTEILSFFILWYTYGLICSYFYYSKKWEIIKDDDNIHLILIIITIFSHYIGLILNGYFPIILSFHYKTSISYHFSHKLMNNLYLFLTNEECYDTFSNYLIKQNNNRGIYYLQLYTHIMKYKLGFVLKTTRFNDANEIYDTYFSNNAIINNIDKVTLDKIRKDCEVLKNNTFPPELFDDALQYCFNELSKIFLVFRNTDEFKNLYDRIKLDSYIQCKMCNTGLINKYY